MMKLGNQTTIWHPEKSVHLDCEIGNNTVIHALTWIGNKVKIGSGCRIQAFCFIPEGVEIGDNVFLGPNITMTNDKNPPSGKESWLKTIIKDGASIGAGCVILPGVTIGKNARIGAGTLITKDVPDNTTLIQKRVNTYLCQT